MSTSPQTTPKSTNGTYHNGTRPVGEQHPLAGLANLPVQGQRPARANFTDVHYTPAWFGLGAVAGTLGLLGLRAFGRRAALGMGALGLLGTGYMALVEPARPQLERVTLRLPNLPAKLDGLRIGQISDCHLGLPHTASNLRWAVEQMRRERPDLLALTGDLVHSHHAIASLPVLLGGLSAPLGIYAVPGNHDYWEGLDDLHRVLAPLGIPLLLNEHRRLQWHGADLWLVGVDDIWDGRPDLGVALHGVPQGAFTLLLAHSPDSADTAAQHGIGVQLSGHTHGGHLRLPFLGPFSLPRFGTRYTIGHYHIGQTQLYVSRGLGGAPLRLLCRPEATIITLRRGH